MPTPADPSDTPQFTIMPLPDPSLRGCPMTDLNRLGHPTLRTSARLDSSDLPQSQRSVPMSVLTPPSHLRDPSSRNFTCPCSWLLSVTISIQQYARILLVTKAGPSSSYCGMRYVWRGPRGPHDAWPLTQASLLMFLCSTAIPRPYLGDAGLSLSHTPTRLCVLGPSRQ